MKMKKKKKMKISESFQQSLLVLVVVAFAVTTTFLWVFQTDLAERNAMNILDLNISDVREDITDASDENLLNIAHQIANDLNDIDEITPEILSDLTAKYDVTEINVSNADGILYATTYPDFMNYDMRSGEQSKEFMVLLEGKTEFVQPYMPVSYDSSISRKYGGVVLERGGFVQVGYDFDRFQKDIGKFILGVTRNRHVGENGCIIIVNEDDKIVSDRFGNEGQDLAVTGLSRDLIPEGEKGDFVANVYGQSCYCKYLNNEGYLIFAVLPESEAALSRDVVVGITTIMQVIMFSALFILIFYLVRKLVVDKIEIITDSLTKISDGDLDTIVDVHSHQEFSSLSNDINATVDTLKKYIADAEARIDAELAFAKAIQLSALPSVFPPYPNRKEFDIWASMHTAKEVGGDFYDFYFIDDDTLAFLVADVSGKGIPAAMFMMESKTLIKSLAQSGMNASEVFTLANEKLCEGNDANMFVTAWMGLLNTKTGLVTYVNAGHNPPVIKHANGKVEHVKSRPGFILASMEGIQYKSFELQLLPGDTLYLYTDGVTEANNMENKLYGDARLLEIIEKNGDDNPTALCNAIKEDLDFFVGEAEQFDDITMLCLKYNANALPKNEDNMKEIRVPATVESIEVVTNFIDEQLDSIDCPLKSKMQIAIAIDEIMGNIAHYAYGEETGDVTVKVLASAENPSIQISFVDGGIPYNPLDSEDPDISLSAEERKIGGLGIFITKNIMDEMTYERDGDFNVLTIKKDL